MVDAIEDVAIVSHEEYAKRERLLIIKT